jgi:hypothetical protein
MRILFVGPLWAGSTSRYRMEAFRQLGHEVLEIDTAPRDRAEEMRFMNRVFNRLGYPRDLPGANRTLLDAARREPVDLLWVEKGRTLLPSTLEAFRAAQPGARMISYSPDDMLYRPNQSRAYLASMPVYDLHVTTKSWQVAELPGIGARAAILSPNAFDPDTHRPVALTPEERARWSSEVLFVGQVDVERVEMVLSLCRAGMEVTVHGPDWHRHRGAHPALHVGERWVSDLDYARAVSGARVTLGFLRRVVRDLQTTRSVEIPACGGFMLADRSTEHQALFAEGVEAAYFGSLDELVAKARYYLDHEDERRAIAAAGRERCLRDDYSYAARLRRVLQHAGLEPGGVAADAAPAAARGG